MAGVLDVRSRVRSRSKKAAEAAIARRYRACRGGSGCGPPGRSDPGAPLDELRRPADPPGAFGRGDAGEAPQGAPEHVVHRDDPPVVSQGARLGSSEDERLEADHFVEVPGADVDLEALSYRTGPYLEADEQPAVGVEVVQGVQVMGNGFEPGEDVLGRRFLRRLLGEPSQAAQGEGLGPRSRSRAPQGLDRQVLGGLGQPVALQGGAVPGAGQVLAPTRLAPTVTFVRR